MNGRPEWGGCLVVSYEGGVADSGAWGNECRTLGGLSPTFCLPSSKIAPFWNILYAVGASHGLTRLVWGIIA